MNLKVGDILEREPNPNYVVNKIKVLGVCGEIVFYDSPIYASPQFESIKVLENMGWQLKKTEEKNPCYVFNGVACQECTKEKTRWLPGRKDVYWYMMDDGRITSKGWYFDYVDAGRYEIFNVFQTKEQAEAYRSELIERNK